MNSAVIEKFYTCFNHKDWQGMHTCYHDDVVFSDPVFPQLKGLEARAMWQMLVTSAKDLSITHHNVKADHQKGSCDWEATYTFSKTGAVVHNRIHAEFEFKDGKIICHADTFDLSRWAGMALGLPGKLLGWTPWMKARIKNTAAASLDKFLDR